MKWFRTYNDITRDRKLRRHRPHVRWAWIAVLCVASESPSRGELLLSENIPATIEDIADEAGLSVNEMEEAFSIFTSQGMVENVGNVWRVTNWDKRQFDRDNSTERVKRFRNRSQKHPVTVAETPCNGCNGVSETPPDPDPDPEYRGKKEEEKDLLATIAFLRGEFAKTRNLIKISDECIEVLLKDYSQEEIGREIPKADKHYSLDGKPTNNVNIRFNSWMENSKNRRPPPDPPQQPKPKYLLPYPDPRTKDVASEATTTKA